MTVYFTDTEAWGDINAYYWGSADSSVDWPGTPATFEKVDHDGHNVYSAVVPADITGLIFNGNGSQTSDITANLVDGGAWRMVDGAVVEGFCPQIIGGGYVLGDADNDEDVTPLDVVYVQRYDANYPIGDVEETIMQADVDGNQAVEIIDATFIQRYLAEMDVIYPIGEVIPA